MCDKRNQTVYHITCALELASDLLADVFTFFSPPAPYLPLFVATFLEHCPPRPIFANLGLEIVRTFRTISSAFKAQPHAPAMEIWA